ncbi:MAG: ATP-dependent RecD-like DNA helicase [Desulfosarcinaceae bacterium]|nr:ATP-dependent RecD-like DNA helicase [Desulfosarcinaceae bacterium]
MKQHGPMPPPDETDEVTLRGQLERITYTSEKTGYTVAKLKVRGRPELVTIVGNLMSPAAGAVLRLRGRWIQHPRFGEQFQVGHYETAVPASVQGIRKYLGSGLIRGIGPTMAGRIVTHFGKAALQIIEEDPDRLTEVAGIGPKRVALIREAWDAQREIRTVMQFLLGHGVSTTYAVKIYKHYGSASLEVMRENPYRLASDIFGIGFVTADRIASQLGFADDTPMRIQAGIVYLLHQLADEGHVYYPFEALVTRSTELLGVAGAAVGSALGVLANAGQVVVEPLPAVPSDSMPVSPHAVSGPAASAELRRNSQAESRSDSAVYLAKYHLCETEIARRLRALQRTPQQTFTQAPSAALAAVGAQLPIELAPRQREALTCALESKLMVLTGGPGTGKTTIITAILELFQYLGVQAALAAPTGRAAKRMSEATGREAKTIHRLLEYSPSKGGFQRNDAKPLDGGLFIIDEASMMDTILLHHLLKAVPPEATLIFVGDANQLPSVGAGSVLADMISSGVVPVVMLTEIFRQAQRSHIVVNAHRINAGQMPITRPIAGDSDFFFIERETPASALETIATLVAERIPRRFGVDAVDDVQVLTPMHRGLVGAGHLNQVLQERLNPRGDVLVRGERHYRIGDKVMQIRNNYDKEIFNGDIGRIAHVDRETQAVVIGFDDRLLTYEFHELDEVVLAYAVSVHKSQGSEYPAVVLALMTQHYVLLQRNLLYTAITRGRRLVVVVGSKRALAMAVNNAKTAARFTRLDARLALI